MIGRKTAVATVMMISVVRLDEASQTVRLAFGSRDDGNRNGNRLTPAVATTPATESALATKARPPRRIKLKPAAAMAPRTPKAGAASSQGAAPKFRIKA